MMKLSLFNLLYERTMNDWLVSGTYNFYLNGNFCYGKKIGYFQKCLRQVMLIFQTGAKLVGPVDFKENINRACSCLTRDGSGIEKAQTWIIIKKTLLFHSYCFFIPNVSAE